MLPIGLIPNGSGNDTCRNLEITTFEQAMEALINHCDLIKSDLCLNYLDHENDEQLKDKFKEDPDKILEYKRYAIINTGLAFIGNAGAKVTPKLKKILGGNAYSFQATISVFGDNVCTYDIDIDHGTKTMNDVKT